MDYSRRPFTASGSGSAINDRVSYNLNRAESLLDEPDTGFSLAANFAGSGVGAGMIGGGIGAGMASGIGSRGGQGAGFGSSNFIAARSNYTGSEMGDSDATSNIESRTRPKWGNQGSIGGGGSGLGGITEIATIEVAGSRRSNRFAGGPSSNHSGSIVANRQSTALGQQSKLFPGAGGSSGIGDMLDNELNKPMLARGRSTNLLSDAGSKYGGEDDNMSNYMG